MDEIYTVLTKIYISVGCECYYDFELVEKKSGKARQKPIIRRESSTPGGIVIIQLSREDQTRSYLSPLSLPHSRTCTRYTQTPNKTPAIARLAPRWCQGLVQRKRSTITVLLVSPKDSRDLLNTFSSSSCWSLSPLSGDCLVAFKRSLSASTGCPQ